MLRDPPRLGRVTALAPLADGLLPAAAKIGQGSEKFTVHAKGQAQPMHEPRLKRGLAIGYAVSPTGADHNHSMHDVNLMNTDESGFPRDGLSRSMGVLTAMPLESLGPDKVRAFAYNTINKVSRNCLTTCGFVSWTDAERMALIEAIRRLQPEFCHLDLAEDQLQTEYSPDDLDAIARSGALRMAAEELQGAVADEALLEDEIGLLDGGEQLLPSDAICFALPLRSSCLTPFATLALK